MKDYNRARLLASIARIEREHDMASLHLLLGEMRKFGYAWSISAFTLDNIEATFSPLGAPGYTALDTDMLFAVCRAARLALRVENVMVTA